MELYLLQLVQALKYENIEELSNPLNEGKKISKGISNGKEGSTTSICVKQFPSLGSFLIERAVENIELATYLYWYLKVELEDSRYGSHYNKVFKAFREKLAKSPSPYLQGAFVKNKTKNESPSIVQKKQSSPFVSVLESLSKYKVVDTKSKLNYRPKSIWDVLVTQDRFISGIMDCQRASRVVKGKKDVKEQHFRDILESGGYRKVINGEMVPLPSAPNILVSGIIPNSARMFKSALYPAVVEFIVEPMEDGSVSKGIDQLPTESDVNVKRAKFDRTLSNKFIFKTGNDLRQDQLVMMMIKLMDRILKRGSLDLCLKPYSIMAISQDSGLLEFISGSFPISQILALHNNCIMHFFQSVAHCESVKYSVRPDVIRTYIRSCAGYCVITYLMGVGDRHLDNIMLLPSGHFFHIDFGFIFGRDPKPLPPPFRLTREMVDGMGGLESIEYRQFCSLSCQAYNLLRKSASLILNLLHLMGDSGIEDLTNNPAADAEGIISKVEERFKLELSDEQAESYFLSQINESLVAIAPRVMDVFHQLSISRR